MATLSLMFGLTLFASMLLVLSITMSGFLRASARPDLLVGTNSRLSRNRKRFIHDR